MYIWRIYNTYMGLEFGQDYSRAEAIATARRFRKLYPTHTYRVRKVWKERATS
jgi:hypothetical protein